MLRYLISLSILAVLSPAAWSQFQEIRIFGGTANTAGRFTTGPEATWNRIPGDQIGGAATVRQSRSWLFDFGPSTSTERVTFHVGIDGATPPSIVASAGPFTISAGSGTIFRITWSGSGIALPSPYPGCATPAHDLWVGVEDLGTGAPSFPSDGLGFVFDAAEVPSSHAAAGSPPYSVSGTFGLNFVDAPPGSGLAAVSDFANFWHSVLVDEDVLQSLVTDGGGAGFTSPNHGFAAICPDLARGDLLGARVGTRFPPGGAGLLLASPFTRPYVPLPILSGGGLCLGAPRFSILLGGPSVPPSIGNPLVLDAGYFGGVNVGSEIVWGPFPVPPVPPGVKLHFQALVWDPNFVFLQLTTLMTIYF